MHPSTRRSRVSPFSLSLGTIAGIPIRLHVTLILMFVWIAMTYWISGLGTPGALAGVLLIALVFVSILAHELCHSIVARRLGIQTREVLLLPIGGIASLERSSDRPSHEIAIALAGPAANIVIAAILGAGLLASGAGFDMYSRTLGAALAVRLLWINVGLAAFNLLPAFPLDGGQLLRAGLEIVLGKPRATRIAARTGIAFAVVLALLGVMHNPWLIVIALFIWFAARRELDHVEIRAGLAGVPAREAMLRRFELLDASESLRHAMRALLEQGHNVVLVRSEGRLLGALTATDIAAALATERPDTPIERLFLHDVLEVAPESRLDDVLPNVETDDVLVVTSNGQPEGVITAEQLATYLALRSPEQGFDLTNQPASR
jgi:Zn-dependent protease/CBS domain-containing protein